MSNVTLVNTLWTCVAIPIQGCEIVCDGLASADVQVARVFVETRAKVCHRYSRGGKPRRVSGL